MLKFYNRERIKLNVKLRISDKKDYVGGVEGFRNVNKEPSLKLEYINY